MGFQKYAIILVCAASLEVWVCLAQNLEDYFYHLQTFEDSIGAGNYTYFKLGRSGNIRIFLQTLEGDADLYVSQTNSKPTFEDYDMKSVTCGDDVIDIPDTFQRPTAIAVYGHPRFLESQFRCSVYVDTRDNSQTDFDLPTPSEQSHEDEYSGWLFLLKVLEVMLDVAL